MHLICSRFTMNISTKMLPVQWALLILPVTQWIKTALRHNIFSLPCRRPIFTISALLEVFKLGFCRRSIKKSGSPAWSPGSATGPHYVIGPPQLSSIAMLFYIAHFSLPCKVSIIQLQWILYSEVHTHLSLIYQTHFTLYIIYYTIYTHPNPTQWQLFTYSPLDLWHMSKIVPVNSTEESSNNSTQSRATYAVIQWFCCKVVKLKKYESVAV